jgi:hypothetical protein
MDCLAALYCVFFCQRTLCLFVSFPSCLICVPAVRLLFLNATFSLPICMPAYPFASFLLDCHSFLSSKDGFPVSSPRHAVVCPFVFLPVCLSGFMAACPPTYLLSCPYTCLSIYLLIVQYVIVNKHSAGQEDSILYKPYTVLYCTYTKHVETSWIPVPFKPTSL